MKTAEKIMHEHGIQMVDFISSSNWFAIKKAINDARKEAIKECAKVAKVMVDKTFAPLMNEYKVDKESILRLINELK